MGRGLWILVLAVSVAWIGGAEGKFRRPNMIVILLDDLGYHDLSIQGSSDVQSPNIDQLMRDGVRFTDAYSVAGFCSPARAGLLGGIHPFHMGHWFNPPHDEGDSHSGMPLGVTILPETLKKRGYKTLALGKWHLGFYAWFHPMHRGFDHFFGFLGGRFAYFKKKYLVRKVFEYLYDGFKVAKKVRYLTHDITDAALKFISQNREDPFFIFMAYNAPHGPYQYLQKDARADVSPRRRPHVAMNAAIDRDIGKLRAHLSKLGLANDTLIIFTNDNGGHNEGSDNTPLRDYKGELYEGGVRIPFSMTWPGTIAPGQVSGKLVSLLDIYPTLQNAARVSERHRNHKLEGVDLTPHVRLVGAARPQKPGATRRAIFNRKRDKWGTVRAGPWKLWIKNGRPWWLYNLGKDVAERNSVLHKQYGRAKILKELFDEWDRETVPSKVPRSLGNRQRLTNPLSVTITEAPPSTRVGETIKLEAKGTNSRARKVTYAWEVFRPKDYVFAEFNTITKVQGVWISQRVSRRTKMNFKEAGKWVIRINIEDKRFTKWVDHTIFVKGDGPDARAAEDAGYEVLVARQQSFTRPSRARAGPT